MDLPETGNERVKGVSCHKNGSQVARDEDGEGDQEVEAEDDADDQDADGHEKVFTESLKLSYYQM